MLEQFQKFELKKQELIKGGSQKQRPPTAPIFSSNTALNGSRQQSDGTYARLKQIG